jgi:hypothetical protein
MGALGDVVRGMYLVNSIKASQPDAHITWLVEPACSGILKLHPAIDEIIVFNRPKGIAGVLEIRRELVKRSFDVTLDYAGTQYTQNVTGQNLASLATYDVTFTGISLTPGSNVAIANITNINGGADDDATDNVTSVTVDPVVPALGKMVVGEE